MLTRRELIKGVAGAGAVALATGSGRIPLLGQAQQPNLNQLQTWYNANGSATQAKANTAAANAQVHYNNMNMGPGFWDSSDLRSLSDVANDLGYFFYNTGSPSFDSSHMSTTLVNVPSPGTAASVLFQQPQQAQVQGAYNAAINYGLNVTWGGWTEISARTGVAQAGYINDLPNWSSSNPLYQMATFTSSQAFWDGASALVAAAEYFDFYLITGSANIGPGLDQATCDKLTRFAEVAGGIGLILGGVGFIFPPLAPITEPIAAALVIWAGIVDIVLGLMCF